MMGRPHQIVVLVVECGVEEEAIMLQLEVLVLLADSAFAECQELFAFRQGSHGNGPFLERNWHRVLSQVGGCYG